MTKTSKTALLTAMAALAGTRVWAASPESLKASAERMTLPSVQQIRTQDSPRFIAVEAVPVGPQARPSASAKPASIDIEWILIPGGTYGMGNDNGLADERPMHSVTIKPFEMSKTPVTVAQYAECVAAGSCRKPTTGGFCNWGKAGRELHPVNCVGWDQATQFAKFKGARLPSEAEWEYAARSGGRNQQYPWGDEAPTCDRAVMYGNGGYGCGTGGTMPVCSKPLGNTAQGLCDMAGEVNACIQDLYHDSYAGAPTDGSAWETPSDNPQQMPGRVLRGGSFYPDPRELRSDFRGDLPESFTVDTVGIRLARDAGTSR